jgi:CheY-like chemotaxis protein
MPGMDGFAVAEHIRRRPAQAGATVVMLTSDDRAGDQARCRQLGMAGCLVKPVTRAGLLASITAALSAAPPRPPSRARASVTRAAESSGLRILLAEDNLVNQRVAAALLERDGHTVIVVANGAAAVSAAADDDFDAIFMDVQMPEMSGFEATAAIRLREQQSGNHTRIIAMTAHAMQGDRERCLAAGMDGYIAKPVGVEELRQTLSFEQS